MTLANHYESMIRLVQRKQRTTIMGIQEILRLHGLWLRNEPNGARANLRCAYLARADLSSADLSGADLRGANLYGAIGNMREIVSAQFETWPVAAARMLDGSVVMQIGCQRHPLEMWEKGDPRWIAAMDDAAPAWWAKWGTLALAIGNAAKGD